MKISNLLFFPLFFFISCTQKAPQETHSAFTKGQGEVQTVYDWYDILSSGELLAVTLSGPDTYFDYQGRGMGKHYALVEHFAQKNGLRVRMEVVHAIDELLHLLKSAEADVICYPLPDSLIRANGLRRAGVVDDSAQVAWAVRPDAPMLAEALDDWYGVGIEVSVEKTERANLQRQHQVRRKPRAPYISKAKGIISVYDDHFKKAARVVGWDWRLIAAQCYQESGFDPAAESWAGAKGLMQIMPGSAEQLGLSFHHIFDPTENVAAAAKYLQLLNEKFSDIRHPEERTKFVLAAYNGGAGHVRDAMALAKKYGHDSKRWDDVAPFILKLSEPRYYRDPVVKYGYMIGRETYDYVYAIWDRWRAYGGKVGAMHYATSPAGTGAPQKEWKKNRFTKPNKIYRPDDPEFSQGEITN